MAVKPAPGEILVTETRQKVETPPAPGAKDPSLPTQSQFMEWVQAQPEAVWEKRELAVRIYRGTDTKFFLTKVLRPPFSYEWIQQTYGGGQFKILGYEGPQLRWNVDIEIFGRPKEPDEVQTPANGQPANSESSLMRDLVTMLRDELRAARGGDVATEAVRQAVALNGEVFRGAVNSVNGVLHPSGPSAPNPMDDLMRQFMTAAIAKMMNPADPIENFAKMVTAMNGLGLNGGSHGTGNLVSDAIRALPAVMTGLGNITANMARAKQIEIEGFREMQRNGIPMRPPVNLVPEGAAAPQPRPAPPPPAAAPANGNGVGGLLEPRDGIELIEAGIVNVLIDPSRPVDECADQVLKTLDSMVPDWVDQMIAEGEANLLKLFRERRILAQIPQNPRLTEFVKKFLQYARESRTPESPGVTSAAPPASNVAEVLEPQTV